MFGNGSTGVFLYGENYQHISQRDDWDALNRELFSEVIGPWTTNGVAVISNLDWGDSPLEPPRMMVQTQLDPAMKRVLLEFRKEDFERIFELAAGKFPDVSDCYRVRNLGLPRNSLVFLVEHADGVRRTMLVFGG